MTPISGLDELNRHLEDAQKALENLDGELGVVNFDPCDPASIEAAIVSVESIIDERIQGYEGNQIIKELADGLKAEYREQIISRAAEARLGGE